MVAVAALLLVGGRATAQAKFHIGMMTPPVSSSDGIPDGAQLLIKEHRTVQDGGLIQRVAYPADFWMQRDRVIASLVALADDPLMKAIVVSPAIPGAAEALRRIRARRPDILLLASNPQDPSSAIEPAADLVVDSDFVARGYVQAWGAKQLGAGTFVHVSFPRHLAFESTGRRRTVMEQAARELGLKFATETAPDPRDDAVAAQQFIRQKLPEWIRKYGPDAVFFCSHSVHQRALREQLPSTGGMVVEADIPSPLMGYPGALGVDLSKEQGDFRAILQKVEEAVKAKGGAGRFGAWAGSYDAAVDAGLGTLAIRVAGGQAKKDSTPDLLAAIVKYTPGASWSAHRRVDPASDTEAGNHLLLHMKTFVSGKRGELLTPPVTPAKYYSLGAR